MKNKSKEDILKGYFWALEKMRPTLRTLFRAALKARQELEGLQLRPQKKPNLLQVIGWATTYERAQEIYAGSIFLVLDEWIKGLAKSLGLNPNRGGFGEKVREVYLSDLIRATANNFRHYREWDKPDSRAAKNIEILDGAGLHNVHDLIIAPQVLEILSLRTFREFEAKLHHLGYCMLDAISDT